MKIIWTICGVILGSLFLVSCSKESPMPILKDGTRLHQDCIRLFGQYQSGEIPRERLPHSLADLKPLRVTREANCIEILVFQEQGKGSWGYNVFPDLQTSPSTKGVWIQKTEFKGIYIFKKWN